MYTPKGKNKNLSKEQLLAKLMKYCAYQERSLKEVEQKLSDLDCAEDLKAPIIDYLIEERFVDEERFAKYYVLGKFKYNQWGRIKIKMGLRQKGISEQLIEAYLPEIKPEEYAKTIQKLIEKKKGSTNEADPYKLKAKILNFVVGKGFEFEEVNALLD